MLLAIGAGALAALVAWRAPARRVIVALAPLALLFLPWLPFPVPAAFLAWTGPMASLIWTAVAVSLGAVVFQDRIRLPADPSRSTLLAGVLAALVFSLAAWGASAARPGGDEPHYLVITQSLLRDGDLKIENNHQRGDYRAYFPGDLAPHSVRHGRNGEVYSIHAPGVPALVAPAFAIAGYHGVVAFLILVSAAGCALAWRLAWRVTGSTGAAWIGWAAVTLSPPFLLESFTVFPDGPGAVIVLTGFWALIRTEEKEDSSWMVWALHGLALALLPWMHTRFAVLAGTLGGLIMVRIARVPNPLAKAVAFLVAPAVSALAWLFFFAIIYGTPDPSAPYGSDTQNALAYFPNGVGGLLFDQGFGLFATAPILLIALAGFMGARRLGLEWLVVALPYLLAVATFAMWWAGMSGPARFLVPLVLPLAIPAACAWNIAGWKPARSLIVAALVVTAWLSAVMAGAGGGRLGYHTRNEAGLTAAPYLEWANHVVDLPAATPAFVPQPVQPDPGGLVSRANAARSGFLLTVVWVVSLGGAIALALWRGGGPWLPIAAALGAMIAMTIAWAVQRSTPVTAVAAQMDALRRLSGGGVIAAGITPMRRLTTDAAWEMRMEMPVRRIRGGRLNAPLVAFPAVPAGSYVMSVRRRGGDGWLMVGVGNDQFAIVTQPIAAFDAGVPITLPVDARALLVRTDEMARGQLEAIELRPVAPAASRAPSEIARRAVRYDSAVCFFLDDRAYPEPAGFWVAGGRETAIALQPDAPRPMALLLRNGAADNVVTVQSDSGREDVVLKAGEERRVDVPDAGVLRIRSATSFRPSEVNAGSRDTRLLGVFVRPLD